VFTASAARLYLIPAQRIVVEHAGHLVKGNFQPAQNIGNLRHRAGAAVGKPFTGHRGAIFHGIELRVVDGSSGLQVQQNHRQLSALNDGKNRRRESIRGHVHQQQVEILCSAQMPGF